MTTVKMLITCLVILSINGCSSSIKYIKCSTPNITKPVLDNTRYSDILLNSKKCVSNYILLKAYSNELELANKVCK